MKINKISSEKEILSDFYKIAAAPRRPPPRPATALNQSPLIVAEPPPGPAPKPTETPSASNTPEPEAPAAPKAPEESSSAQAPDSNKPNVSGNLDLQISKALSDAVETLNNEWMPINELFRFQALFSELRSYSTDIGIQFIKSIDILFPKLNFGQEFSLLSTINNTTIINFLKKELEDGVKTLDRNKLSRESYVGAVGDDVTADDLAKLADLYSKLASEISQYESSSGVKFFLNLNKVFNGDIKNYGLLYEINRNLEDVDLKILNTHGYIFEYLEIMYDRSLGNLPIQSLSISNNMRDAQEKILQDISDAIKDTVETNNFSNQAPRAVAPPPPISSSDLPAAKMPYWLREGFDDLEESANPAQVIDEIVQGAPDPVGAKAAVNTGSESTQQVAEATKAVKAAADEVFAGIKAAAASGNQSQLDNAVDAAASVAVDTSAQVTGAQSLLVSAMAAAPTPTQTPSLSPSSATSIKSAPAAGQLPRPSTSRPPATSPPQIRQVRPNLPPAPSASPGASSGVGNPTTNAPAANSVTPTNTNSAGTNLPAAPVAAPATPVAAPAAPVSPALPQAAQAIPTASAVTTPTPPAAAQAIATATAAGTAAATTVSQAQAATAKVSRLKKLYDTTKDFAQKSAIAKAIGSATVWAATLAAKTAVFLGICYGAYSLHNYLLKDESDAIGEDFLSGASTQFGDLSDNSSLLGGASLDPLNLDEKIGGRADRAIQKAKSLIESGQEAAADVLLNRVAKVYDASGYHKLSPEVSAALSSWTSSDIKYVFPRKSLGARSPLDRARALATEKKILDILTNSNKTNDAVKGRIINDSGTSDGQQIANYMFSTVANKGLFTGGIGGSRRARRWSKGKELDSRENLGFSGSRDRKLTRQERKEQRAMGKSDVIDSADDPFSIFSAAEKEFLEKNSSNYNKSTNFNNINKKADKISDGYFKDAIKDLDNDAQIKEYYIAYSELYDAKVEKKPQTFKDLYKVPSKDLTNKAHPKSIVLSDAKGNGGLIENGDEAQKAIIDVVTRNPTGFNNHRYAFIRNALKKI